jgi:hypothetical protein
MGVEDRPGPLQAVTAAAKTRPVMMVTGTMSRQEDSIGYTCSRSGGCFATSTSEPA